MTDAITSAASNAVGTLMVDCLLKPIERHLRYLFRHNNLVEELQEQKKNLSKEQARVHEDVEEATRHVQTLVIEEYVEDWLTDAENVLKEAESLECRIEENKRCFRWCPNWSWRYQLSKEIEQKTVAIRKLVDSSKFDRVGHRALLPGLEFLNFKDFIASKSSTSAFNKIIEALKGDENNLIGVWGMGGVGKTTLVTEVGNKVKDLQLFDRVIKAVVSQTPIIESIQNKIADFLDLKFEKMTKEGKAEELWLRLENEKKVLIILDDLWKELNLKEIGIPFGENRKGCKIILTTRLRPVCESMASDVTVSLGVLDEDEAWTLFKTKASLDEDKDHAETIKVAKEVAKECKGLPVAIVTLARALKGTKTVKGWEVARKKLGSSRLLEIGNIEEEVEKNAFMCLKMSYEYLKKDATRRCFLLCALYPEDHSIDVEDLVRYAWALRLYQNAGSIEEVRFEVLEAIDNLKDSCLLLEDDQKRYIKLHDVVRDVALWIASSEDNGLVARSGVESENESSKQKLEILLLDDYDSETPIEGFEEMQELKVLSLKSVYVSNNRVFSLNALKCLTNLRALHLKGFEKLEGISALAKLTKLEILCLHGSEFQEPIEKLGELKHLKVLDIRRCKFLFHFPPSLIRRLVEIEELCLSRLTNKGSDGDVCTAFLSELNLLPRLTSLLLEVCSLHFPEDFVFPRLERYKIDIGVSDMTDLDVISSRFLRISKELPLDVISKLLWNIEFLGVCRIMTEDIKCLTDTTPGNVPVATILQNLKGVGIEKCENLQVIFQMKKAENHTLLLSKLKHLWLSRLPNLEYIWKMPNRHISLRSLEAVEIRQCEKLKSLFSFSVAQSLERLEKLKIDGCVELKQIVEESESDDQEISPNMSPDKPPCFQNLTSLEICYCDSLEFIFPNFMAHQGLPQLQKLKMTRLSQLKQICRPAKQREENGTLLPRLQLLPSLTDLTLCGCPELTDATIHSEPARASLQNVQLSKLKGLFVNTKNLSLWEIWDHNLIPEVDGEGLNELIFLRLQNCHSLEYLVDTTKEHVPNSAFTNLVELALERMGGLKMLCNGLFPKGFLQNLKKLTVSECGELQEVFQIDDENQAQLQLLSNLEHLKVDKLPELRWILKGSAHCFSLQSLKVVNIYRCKKLKSVFSASLIQSLQQLEQLYIQGCDELETLFPELESDGETEPNSHLQPPCLPRFKNLRIFECPRLEYVLPITLAQGLPQLEVLLIEGCYNHQLKQVFGVAKEHDGVEHCIKLPRLKHLQLDYFKNLSSFGPENYFFKAPALENLCVCACPQLMKFPIEQEVDSRLRLQDGVRLSAFKEFLRNTNYLSLERIKGHKNLIPEVAVDVEGLTSLVLDSCKDLECLADTTEDHMATSGVFTNLVEIFMIDMIGLKLLCKGRPPKGFLRNLKMLTVERCMDIVSLSSVAVAQNLKRLRVEECEKLEEIFGIDELLYDREENQAPLLENLHSLELWFIPELRWIVKGPTQYVSLRSLKVVSIYKCNKLESLFSSSLIPSLRSVEDLSISCCDKLEMVFTEFESADETTRSSTLCMPNLKTFKISECPTLKYVFTVASALDLPQSTDHQSIVTDCPENCFIEAPALENFQVSGCPRLSNFTIQHDQEFEECIDDADLCNNLLRERSPNRMNFELLFRFPGGCNFMSSLQTLEFYDLNWHRYIFPIMLFRNLPKLRILKIRGCEKLEQIFVNDDTWPPSSQGHEKEMLMFPQVKYLSLKMLPSLISFSPVGHHLVFPSLLSLEIEDCFRMITSFTIDSTKCVHAETKAPRLDDATPSERGIQWSKRFPFSLPPYVEEEEEEEEEEDEI